jgi:hypothetical protein
VPTIIRASVNAETGHSGLPVLRRRGVPTASEGGGEQPGGETGGADHDGLGGQQPTAVGRGGQRDADQPAPVLAGDEDRGHHDQRDQPEERPGQRPLPGDDISGVPGVLVFPSFLVRVAGRRAAGRSYCRGERLRRG